MGAMKCSGMCISRKGDKVKDKDGENPVLMERIQKTGKGKEGSTGREKDIKSQC